MPACRATGSSSSEPPRLLRQKELKLGIPTARAYNITLQTRNDGDELLINANKEWEKFEDLLRRTVEDSPPPDPSDYNRFTYSSLYWCAGDGMFFSSRYNNGLALALLRNERPIEALRLLALTDPAKAELLLPAFGADPETFVSDSDKSRSGAHGPGSAPGSAFQNIGQRRGVAGKTRPSCTVGPVH